MRQTKIFDMFGVKYESIQFSAVEAMKILSQKKDNDILFLLKYTSVQGGEVLDNKESINKNVVDKMNHLPGGIVLRGLTKVIYDFNFGFLLDFKMVKTPIKFLSDSKTIFSAHIDPMLANIISERLASLEKLEQYYSLQDAYILFDILVAKGVTEAYGTDQAIKDSKANK